MTFFYCCSVVQEGPDSCKMNNSQFLLQSGSSNECDILVSTESLEEMDSCSSSQEELAPAAALPTVPYSSDAGIDYEMYE